MITIKKISDQDLPQLAKLYEKLINHPSDLLTMRKLFPLIDCNENYYLLGAFTENNGLIGTVMGIACYDLCKRCQPFLTGENLIIDEAYQGRGIGTLLFEKLESIGRERDCVFFQFCSSGYRKGAHKFYAAMGYDPDEVKGYRKYFTITD